MEWNVYYHSINERKIKTFNIFNHGGFQKSAEDNLRKCKSREEFANALKSDLMYYFWAKCEWEVLVSPWVGDGTALKTDVYNQVILNFEAFLDYIWRHKDAE